jgi:uncharacterized OsmC-like protein
MAESITTPRFLNGVNLDLVVEVINALKTDPHSARIAFCAKTDWINGRDNTKIKIQKLNEIEATSQDFQVPVARSGATELLESGGVPYFIVNALTALSSCITADFLLHAALRNIQLDELQLCMEAEIDLRGFFGLSEKIRSGYQCVQLTYRVKSDAPRAELENLCEYVQKISPVLDSLCHPVPVTIELQD